MAVGIVRCSAKHAEDWVRFRQMLWHDAGEKALREEVAAMLEQPEKYAGFLAIDDKTGPVGFAEVSIRHDPVNGCLTSPVAFLEGIYILHDARRKGAASVLIHAVESWARGKGVSELGSDAYLDNTVSHAMHRALGFEETSHVVYFRKEIS